MENSIFLDHYYEIEYGEGSELNVTFYYLNNKQNPLSIHQVNVGETKGYPYQDNTSFMWDDNSVQYEQEFRHYYLQAATINFSPIENTDLENQGTWSFDKMDVFFSDATTITADIGEIHFYPQPEFDFVFNFFSSSGNSIVDSPIGQVEESVTITDIDVPFVELKDKISLELDLDQDRLEKFSVGKIKDYIPDTLNDRSNLETIHGEDVDQLLPVSVEKGD